MFQYSIMTLDGGERFVTAIVPGHNKPLTAGQDHPNFQKILTECVAETPNEQLIAELFDIPATVEKKFARLSERVTTRNGKIFIDGDTVDNALTGQILRFMDEGVDDWEPLVAFMENVLLNPQTESREQLYGWLEKHKFTITEDGYIVGYKGVTKDEKGEYISVFEGTATVDGEQITGHIPNPIGATIEMPRSAVRHDPHAACHVGLHVATFGFAEGFGHGVTLEVHINPRDVVSVPHAAEKMRVCRYTVVGLAEGSRPEALYVAGKDLPYEAEDYDECNDNCEDCSCNEEVSEPSKIEDGRIVVDRIPDAVTSDQIVKDAIRTEDITGGTITAKSIVSGTINTDSFTLPVNELIDAFFEATDALTDVHPSEDEWENMKARAKRRRRNFEKYAKKNGWTLTGADPSVRTEWQV
jgi:hypothetical protein